MCWERFIVIQEYFNCCQPCFIGASLVVQLVKNLCAMKETWVRSLGQEDPLAKETATHSSTLAWRIPWTEEAGRIQSLGSQRVGHNSATDTFTFKGKIIKLIITLQVLL